MIGAPCGAKLILIAYPYLTAFYIWILQLSSIAWLPTIVHRLYMRDVDQAPGKSSFPEPWYRGSSLLRQI